MIIGFTCSTFDYFHAGHVAMLSEARKQCDYLIVGLQTDPTKDRPEKHKPDQSILERFIQVQGCKFVDKIYPYDNEEDLYNLLCILKPDVRIIGEEYKNKHFTGDDLPIKIYYNSRSHNYSSTKIRNDKTT